MAQTRYHTVQHPRLGTCAIWFQITSFGYPASFSPVWGGDPGAGAEFEIDRVYDEGEEIRWYLPLKSDIWDELYVLVGDTYDFDRAARDDSEYDWIE